jgi:hypothetical protein
MQKDIEITMPPFKSQLMVECYLVPGEKMKLALSESVAIQTIIDTPYVHNAMVVISFNSERDTLIETGNGIYENNRIVPPDYNEKFHLYINDKQGREITSETTICKPVSIDSINFNFNSQNMGQCIMYFTDPEGDNYYSAFIRRNITKWEYFADDKFNGTSIPYQSGFYLNDSEKIEVVLTHVNKEAYEFVRSAQIIFDANSTPINEPGPLRGNINNGLGIFTGFYPSIQDVIVYR